MMPVQIGLTMVKTIRPWRAGVDRAKDNEGPDGGPASDVSFPDAPRLQLDQLLGELTERAQEVMTAQNKLRGLLRANAAVVAELSLPAVLHRIVTAACELLQARYAALGVIGQDGLLEQFVHAGIDGQHEIRAVAQFAHALGSFVYGEAQGAAGELGWAEEHNLAFSLGRRAHYGADGGRRNRRRGGSGRRRCGFGRRGP